MIKLNDFVSLSEGKTISGKFSIDWTKTFEEIQTPHRKQNCFHLFNGEFCVDCIIKPEKNCFICEVERASKSCLDRVSKKRHILLILLG